MRIFLPKLGWMRYRNSRTVLGAIKNATVSWHNGRWFVSIQTEREVEVPTPKGDAIGIDMGIVRFATLSDGSSVESLTCFRHHEIALRKAQQAMSRKTKFSSNWRKAKKKVQRIHARVANVRNDFLHKLSTAISKNHAIVCVEDLQVSNMSHVASEKRKTQTEFRCVECGFNENADVVGAINIRREGLSRHIHGAIRPG